MVLNFCEDETEIQFLDCIDCEDIDCDEPRNQKELCFFLFVLCVQFERERERERDFEDQRDRERKRERELGEKER